MKKFFVYLLSLGHLSVDLAPGALPAVLPFLVLHNGLSYTEVAGLMFASSCLSSFVQPIFGFWADKSTKNWFLSLGILTSGIGLGKVLINSPQLREKVVVYPRELRQRQLAQGNKVLYLDPYPIPDKSPLRKIKRQIFHLAAVAAIDRRYSRE